MEEVYRFPSCDSNLPTHSRFPSWGCIKTTPVGFTASGGAVSFPVKSVFLLRGVFLGAERAGRGFRGLVSWVWASFPARFLAQATFRARGGISLVFKTSLSDDLLSESPGSPNPSSPRTRDPEKRERENPQNQEQTKPVQPSRIWVPACAE
jgi:hypothetical protein